MNNAQVRISVKGKQTNVPSILVDNLEIVTIGKYLRIASVRSEDYCESSPLQNPEQLIAEFKRRGGKADIFSFAQRVTDVVQRYEYPTHWDNAAAIPLKSYSYWWNGLSQETRRNVRLATKRGSVVSAVPFNDKLVRGIEGIYNETLFRQGRRFWHYGKDFETVKRENGTFADRSQFIAAYCGDELIGFIKMVYVGNIASIMQILSKAGHQDKKPTNALIAKAVEICADKGLTHLQYCKYVYHKNYQNALTEFKRRNGFVEICFPRYFVPLTFKGRMAISLKLQLGPAEVLPRYVVSALLNIRKKYSTLVHRIC